MNNHMLNKVWLKLVIDSQISTVATLKFGNESVIYHALYIGFYYLSMPHVSKEVLIGSWKKVTVIFEDKIFKYNFVIDSKIII